MGHFTTRQGVLFYDYTLEVKQSTEMDGLLGLLEDSGVAGLIGKGVPATDFGRPGFNPYDMFACILYGFAMGRSSLRELEDACRYDARYPTIGSGGRESSRSRWSSC